MVSKQFSGSAEDADLRRADSLAREIFSDVPAQSESQFENRRDGDSQQPVKAQPPCLTACLATLRLPAGQKPGVGRHTGSGVLSAVVDH